MAITGTPAGGISTFQSSPSAPPGAVFPAGTTFAYSVDDTADITLAPNPAAPTDPTQVQATCIAAPAATSYNLTCTSSFTPLGASAPLAVTVNVPILAAAVPTPTAMAINQLS